jgi:cytochrome b561
MTARTPAPSSPATAFGRYTRTAVALHWLLALLLLTSFCVGVYMHDLPLTPTRVRLFNWHKWAGITILALSFLRIAWRLWHPPPTDLPMSPWQRRGACLAHRAMYLLFFAVPLVGWAYSSATGFQVVVFGVLPLPDFVAKSKPLADALESTHAALAWTLAAIVLMHVAGALKHQFIDRDGLLSRMWFGRRGARSRLPARQRDAREARRGQAWEGHP